MTTGTELNIFILKLIGYLLASLYLSIAIAKSNNCSYSLRFISFYFSLQFLFILLYAYVDDLDIIPNHLDKYIRISENIDTYGVSILLVQLSFLLLTKLSNPYLKWSFKIDGLINSIKLGRNRTIEHFLIFTGVIFLTYPFAGYFGPIGYAIQICFNFSVLIPFVVGVYALQNWKITFFWLASMTFLFIVSVIGGSRGVGFQPIILFLFGFFYNIKGLANRLKYVFMILVLGIPGLSFFSFIGYFRHIVGRSAFDDITTEKITSVYNTYKKLEGTRKLEKISKLEKKNNGIGRFINQVNIAVVSIVPERVDYIGLQGLDKEFQYSFDLAFITKTTRKERIENKVANFRMVNYGFETNEKSSVECSVFTEGWIRFGMFGAIFNHLLYGLLLYITEIALVFKFRQMPKIRAIFTMAIIFASYQSYAYNLFPNIRNLFLGIFFTFSVLLILSQIRQFFKKALRAN